MPHNAAFHHGLHRLIRLKQHAGKGMHQNLENLPEVPKSKNNGHSHTYCINMYVGNYLRGMVLQGCRLLKRCQNLPARHCVAEVGLLSHVRTYLPGTVLQGCRLFTTSWALWGRGAGCLRGVGTCLPGTVGKFSRLFKRCWNLPPGHCWARGAGC